MLEQAITNKDYKQVLVALEMTDDEYREIGYRISMAAVNLKKNIGPSFDKLTEIYQKEKCQSCSQLNTTDKINSMLNADFIQMPSEFSKRIQSGEKGAQLQGCRNYWWWLLLPVFVSACFAAAVGGVIALPLAYWWLQPSQQAEILAMLNLPDCLIKLPDFICSLP
jgi:hypothetical protein